MAFTSSLAFVALLLCFSFSVNPQPYIYPTASAPVSWTNSFCLLLRQTNDGSGLSFATGFYCLPPCKSYFLSIYIIEAYVHNDSLVSVGSPQVIWSANRARPVSEDATLQLTSKDGLTLRDSDGSLVWSTSGLNRSVAGINITEIGNLLLFDVNNSTIWQSFDHPTDCIVMGQTLAGGMRLIANSSSTSLAESQIYLTLLADGLYGFVDSNPPQRYYYYKTGPFVNSNRTVNKSISLKFMNGSLTMFSMLSNTDMDTIFFFPYANSIQFMRLEYDGHLRLYEYYGSELTMVDDLFDRQLRNCDYPTVCGHYGICNNGQCTCPTTETSENYFKLVDNRHAELGCSAVTNISCQDVNNHLLLDLKYVSYFNFAENVANSTTDEESCKKACLGDCKCKAALFQSINGTCLTLTEVFSLQDIQSENQSNSTAYIKVQVAPSPPSSPLPPSSSKVGLGAILGSIFGALLFLLTLISIYKVCLGRREEAQDEDIIEQIPGMPTRFTYKELQEATGNFVKFSEKVDLVQCLKEGGGMRE